MYLIRLLLGLLTKPRDAEQDEFGNWWEYRHNRAVFKRGGADFAYVHYYRVYLKVIQDKWGIWQLTCEKLVLDKPLKYYREISQGLEPGWDSEL